MNLPLSKFYQETIIVKDFLLRIHVIGVGAIGEIVLANIRTHYDRHPSGSLVDEEFETAESNELIFLVADLSVADKGDVACIAASLANKDTALPFLFTVNDHASDQSSEKFLQRERNKLFEQIHAHVDILTAQATDAETAGEIIFERIRSIVSAIATPGSINVGVSDFYIAMTGPWACATIKPGWGEAQGPDRAAHATATALACPSFREHLRQADGIVCRITGNAKYLMGREVKQVGNEIRKYGSERCGCLCSICYDPEMQSDVLKVDIFASQWAA